MHRRKAYHTLDRGTFSVYRVLDDAAAPSIRSYAVTSSADRSDLDFALRVVLRRKMIIGVCALVATAAALGFSLASVKQYTATATLFFRNTNFDQQVLGGSGVAQPLPLSTQDAASNVALVALAQTADATSSALPPTDQFTPGQVRAAVSVSSEAGSNLVDIQVTTPRPALSATVANTYARQFISARVQADRSTITEAQGLVSGQLANPNINGALRQQLESRSEQLRILSALQTGNAELAQVAAVPGAPSSPRVTRNTAIGLLLGLLLGIAVAVLRERLDRRIKDATELEEAFELPVLGVIPESRSFVAISPSPLPFRDAESFGMLRARLRYFNVDRNIRRLLIASSAPGDGKSTIAFHLAHTAASIGGSRVVLVEADLRKPTLAQNLGLASMPGLSELLTQSLSVSDVMQRVEAGQATEDGEDRDLRVIVAGLKPPNPSELIESQRMAQLLEELSAVFDLVVIDTPPTGVVADAIPLMAQVDGVIIVTRLGRITKTAAVHMRDQLRNLGAPSLGTVANCFVARRGQDGYGYGYGSGYGYGDAKPGHSSGDAESNGAGDSQAVEASRPRPS
jgi:capsular exopolysaccharide synthesis family protein